MGFLQSFTEGEIQLSSSVKSKKSLGLLQKSILLSEKKVLFKDFLSEFKMSGFILLQKTSNKYFVNTSYGLDAESIINFTSTEDFWNGTIIQSEKLYNFENDNLSPFYQFFSFNLKDTIKSLSIFKNDNNSIFIVINKTDFDFDNFYKKAISLIDDNSLFISPNHSGNYKNIKLDFSKCLSSFFEIKKINNFIEEYKKSIINEISIKLSVLFTDMRYFNDSFFVTLPDSTFYDFDLLKKHLVNEFTSFINSDNLEIVDCGISESLRDIKLFLQAD